MHLARTVRKLAGICKTLTPHEGCHRTLILSSWQLADPTRPLLSASWLDNITTAF